MAETVFETRRMIFRPELGFIAPEFPARDKPTIIYEITRKSRKKPT